MLAEGMAKEDQKKEERSAESAAESETEAADSKPGKDKKNSTETSEEKAEEPAIPENIDVDLTLLSSTMVFSEVSNILSNPPDYAGKTIKMRGIYNCYEDPNTAIITVPVSFRTPPPAVLRASNSFFTTDTPIRRIIRQ